MINGLHIDVQGAELRDLLKGRLEYHERRAREYADQLVRLESLQQNMERELGAIQKTSNASPIDSVKQALTRHKNQVVYYKFVSDHVNLSETYRLSENELERIGISTDRWG
jgi:hypothetical protein